MGVTDNFINFFFSKKNNNKVTSMFHNQLIIPFKIIEH
jgi:hypothetical protein